jgi:hypothetical protein
MTDSLLFWLSVMTFALGLLLSGGIAWIGRRLMLWHSRHIHPEYIEHLFVKLMEKDNFSRREELHELTQELSDYRARRNEFWNTLGQIFLSIFIATVITVLLLTKTIDPDAGLPILSGISGFAIAKTVSTAKESRGPRIQG